MKEWLLEDMSISGGEKRENFFCSREILGHLASLSMELRLLYFGHDKQDLLPHAEHHFLKWGLDLVIPVP